MLNTNRIYKRFGDDICRRCINDAYNVKLVPQDCIYGYSSICRVCKNVHHIVVGFSPFGKMKMLMK